MLILKNVSQYCVDEKKGEFYHTTKVYGYIKKHDIPYSYYFLLALMNSTLFWFFLKHTGSVLRGGYYTFKTNYITLIPQHYNLTLFISS